MAESQSDNNQEIEELLKMLEDPGIGEPIKDAIRQSLRKLAHGGFAEAYHTNLEYLARSDLDAFSEHVFDKVPYPHHKEITKILMDDTRKRELIIISPGHGKSSYVSLQFPAWYMGKHPDNATILISNTATQAQKFCASVRETIEGNHKFKSVFPELKKDESRGWTREELFLSNRKDKSRPDPNLLATGVGGPVLGRRADLIIVDDPVSQSDASSEKIMSETKYFFKETLMSRLKPGGRIVVILTRWHDKDLAAMLVNDMDFRVTHMAAIGDDDGGAYTDYVLPGNRYIEKSDEQLEDLVREAEHEGFRAKIAWNDAMNKFCARKYLHPNGEKALWPEEHDMAALERIKKDYGTVRFNLVYQGNPSGLQGDIFKREWFRYYGPGEDRESLPPDCMFFQAVDVAVSTKASADYFVVLTAALDREGNIYIVDVYRTKVEAPDQPKIIAAKYREQPKTIWVLIESVAYQLALFQSTLREGIPCKQYKPVKDKEARGRSAAARFESGSVYINKIGSWKREFEDELTAFPRGEHDDQVDVVSSLLEELALRSVKPVTLQIGFGSEYT